ncbi:TonB-dependent receptor [Candidatus Halobeggiatoa sp. HSG11]|nr:TonB-dependent receptor [Candidatus Halobeggiatoa sp. HSG11]
MKAISRSMKTRRVILALSPILAAMPLLAAEEAYDPLADISLAELFDISIHSATKTDEKLSDVPSVVSLITADEIATYGYRSIAEALSHTVSFIDNGDMVFHNFGVRGINAGVRSGSRTIKVMIDGHPVSFRSTSQNFLGSELIPMELVERIEVIRGPVSALYGANAFQGVVNIVTKQNSPDNEDGTYRYKIAAGKTENAGEIYQAEFVGYNSIGNWNMNYGLGAGMSDRSGIEIPPFSPSYFAHQDGVDGRTLSANSDKSRPLSFYTQINYNSKKKQRANITANFQRLDVDQAFPDLNILRETGINRVQLDNGFINAGYEYDVSDRITTSYNLSYSRGKPGSNDRVEVGANNYYLTRNLGYDAWDVSAELQWTLRDSDTLLLGVDATIENHDLETFNRVEKDSDSSMPITPKAEETLKNHGVYAQWLYQLTDDWRLITGVRLDSHTEYSNQTSYRLGAVGQLSKDWTVKLLAGRSFQAPSPELLYRRPIQLGDVAGNPNLKPQIADTIELNIGGNPFGNNNLQLSVTSFLTEIEDLVSYEEGKTHNLVALNNTGSQSYGLELELRYKYQHTSTYFNSMWQQTEIDDNPIFLDKLHQPGDSSPLFPEFAYNLGVSHYWPTIKFHSALDISYIRRRTASISNILERQSNYQTPDYFAVNLITSIQLFGTENDKGGKLRFKISNIFDRANTNPGFNGIDYPTLGRQFTLSFIHTF